MTSTSRYRFVHLIPHCGIGGVEVAAETMDAVSEPDVSFRVEAVMPGRELTRFAEVVHMYRAARRILNDPPDVLIVSLWKACLVGIIVKLFDSDIRLVLFLHHTDDMHVADWLATRIAFLMSEAVWGDSASTLAHRTGGRARHGQVISFRVAALQPVVRPRPQPIFVFWGRLHRMKRLDRALRIFAAIRRGAGEGQFTIAGPDDGELERLERLVAELELADAVSFIGPVTPEQLPDLARTASFFLMTSEAEGMSVAVVEAMQLGLVPVVTPVGELANYARDGENAVIVSSEAKAVADVLSLLTKPQHMAQLADAAVATWRGQAVYRDSVLAACRAML